MSDSSLSPDEIEALLGDSETPTVEESRPSLASVRACDLAGQQRQVREPIPTLDLVGIRFARNLRQSLTAFTRQRIEVDGAKTLVDSYEGFLERLPERGSADVLRVRPLQGSALLVWDAALVFATVETLFGGTPGAVRTLPARDFTATEQRIIGRLVEQVCAEYRNAWQGVYPLELEPVRSENGPALARIVAPTDTVIATRLDLRIGETAGTVHLCIPYATMEPIRDTLYATVQPDPSRDERRWMQMLTERIQAAEVELVAEFARANATIAELLSLKPGDFIELGLQETISAKVDGVPVFNCRYGVSNGRYAIRIQSYLTDSDPLSGAEHDR